MCLIQDDNSNFKAQNVQKYSFLMIIQLNNVYQNMFNNIHVNRLTPLVYICMSQGDMSAYVHGVYLYTFSNHA